MRSIEIHNLDKSFNRKDFDCGKAPLNDFLKTRARVNQETGFNRTFVAIAADDDKKTVIGYYTLNMSEVRLDSLPEEIRKSLPRYPVPAVKLGRLAVDSRDHGQGIAKSLLVHAMAGIRTASEHVRVYALIVDAKDEEALKFYLHLGFIQFPDEVSSLFLPVASFPR